jgi:hypothetical protein
MNRTVGLVRPGELARNVFNNVGALGQTRPTWFSSERIALKEDVRSENFAGQRNLQ